jgi:hypothetical protein
MRQKRETGCRPRKLSRPAALWLLLILAAPGAHSYSVLTHEAIIDSAWDTAIRPLLLRRFPAATPDELKQAHAYAYGGCIIQDLGYYSYTVRATRKTGALTIGGRGSGRSLASLLRRRRLGQGLMSSINCSLWTGIGAEQSSNAVRIRTAGNFRGSTRR